MKNPDTPNNIPRIIHQLWSGEEKPLPEDLKILSETWKEYHPDWSYELWDNNRINSFIKQYYPNYWNIYSRFPYNVGMLCAISSWTKWAACTLTLIISPFLLSMI